MSQPLIRQDSYWADAWNILMLRPVYREARRTTRSAPAASAKSERKSEPQAEAPATPPQATTQPGEGTAEAPTVSRADPAPSPAEHHAPKHVKSEAPSDVNPEPEKWTEDFSELSYLPMLEGSEPNNLQAYEAKMQKIFIQAVQKAIDESSDEPKASAGLRHLQSEVVNGTLPPTSQLALMESLRRSLVHSSYKVTGVRSHGDSPTTQGFSSWTTQVPVKAYGNIQGGPTEPSNGQAEGDTWSPVDEADPVYMNRVPDVIEQHASMKAHLAALRNEAAAKGLLPTEATPLVFDPTLLPEQITVPLLNSLGFNDLDAAIVHAMFNAVPDLTLKHMFPTEIDRIASRRREIMREQGAHNLVELYRSIQFEYLNRASKDIEAVQTALLLWKWEPRDRAERTLNLKFGRKRSE